MPKIIDHDERRMEIAGAVVRIIARQGISGVTMKIVAKEAGWSTGVLHHYFENKQELLIGGLRFAARETGKSITRVLKHRDPKERLRLVIEAGMPLDESRDALCKIFFFFWAESIADPKLVMELTKNYDWWRDRIRDIVQEGKESGWIKSNVDSLMLAEMFVALADGLSIKAKFSSPAMNKKRLQQHVQLWIDNLC